MRERRGCCSVYPCWHTCTHIHAHTCTRSLDYVLLKEVERKEESKPVSDLSLHPSILPSIPSVFSSVSAPPHYTQTQWTWTSASLPWFCLYVRACMHMCARVYVQKSYVPPRLACVIDSCLTALRVTHYRQGLCACNLLAVLA